MTQEQDRHEAVYLRQIFDDGLCEDGAVVPLHKSQGVNPGVTSREGDHTRC